MLKAHITSKIVESSADYLDLNSLLTPEEIKIRSRIREGLQKDLGPVLNTHIEATTFPREAVIEAYRKLGINGLYNKGYGSAGLSILMSGIAVMELFRFDASIGTFFTVHNAIGMDCIFELGSEAQKQKYLPDCLKFNKICCFGLTEIDHGSDASGIITEARPVHGGYIINGNKRWIGNATWADHMILWARNTDTQKIQGFMLDMNLPGI